MKKFRRWHVFADLRMQGVLCLRVAAYWVVCLASVGAILFWRSALQVGDGAAMGGPGQFWQRNGAVVVLPLLLLPLVLVEALIWSNKLFGPLLRLRRRMKQLARGESIEPLRLRKNDALADMANSLNQIAERLAAHDNGGGGQAEAKHELAELIEG